VVVVETSGREIVAVKRTDLSLDSPEGRGLAIADNRTAELGLEWDPEILSELAAELDLQPYFTDEELQDITGGLGDGTEQESSAVYADEKIIAAAFDYFRASGFPYRKLPLHLSMQEINQLATTDPDALINTDVAYHVADTYHPHRFHASANGMKSPFAAFAEDKLLRRALSLELTKGNSKIPAGYFSSLSIVSGTQACSNFRPGFACYLYRTYCKPGDTVLDSSTGYGGRLVGFLASGIAGKYIGIDPNTLTHAGNVRLATELGFADVVELHNLPAEDVPHDVVAGRCDFSFTSPPYFCKELYSAEPTQSCNRYSTGEAWRDGFLLPMLRLQFAALKPGKTAIVNIADVTINNRTYPLANWTRECAQTVGFRHVRTDEFPMNRRVGRGMPDEVVTEPMIVLQKP
jgi:hypothetical protein